MAEFLITKSAKISFHLGYWRMTDRFLVCVPFYHVETYIMVSEDRKAN